MPLPFTFANATNPTTPQLDANFNALGALVPIVCTASGSNAISLTIAANNPTVSALANYQPFTFIAPATNTGAVTIAVGSLAALPAYIDQGTGPASLSGAEIRVGNLVEAIYDSALNSGGGGFHLITRPMINPMTAVNDLILGGTSGIPARLAVGAVGQFLVVRTSGNVGWSDTSLGKAAIAAVTAATGTTLTAAQITGNGYGQGIIARSGPTGSFTDTTDTAANIVAALPAAAVGLCFRTKIIVAAGTQTLAGGTGVTVAGDTSSTASASGNWVGIITALTPSAAVSMYN